MSIGRPKLPEDKLQKVLFSVRFTELESELICREARIKQVTVSKYISDRVRDALYVREKTK